MEVPEAGSESLRCVEAGAGENAGPVGLGTHLEAVIGCFELSIAKSPTGLPTRSF
jgi:hypothetical protein